MLLTHDYLYGTLYGTYKRLKLHRQFRSRRRHTSWNCDWSSDVCSSDLLELAHAHAEAAVAHHRDRLHPGAAEVRADRSGERGAQRAMRPVGKEAPAGAPGLLARREVRA